MELKLPFGLKNEMLVDITQVTSGLSCECVCPACGGRLVARKGAKTSHHFAHHQSALCAGGYQTALHMAAKEILLKHKKICIPAVITGTAQGPGEAVYLHKEQTVQFDDVILEKREGEIIPDVVVLKGGKKMYIEIAVTHFVNPQKLDKIVKQNVSTLEIDISGFERNIDFSILEHMLLSDSKNKKWIYNAKIASFQNDLRAISREFDVTRRGLAAHIDNCPLPARVWKGKPYANLIDDCFSCKYFYSSEEEDFEGHVSIQCLGHAKELINQIIQKHQHTKPA